MEKFPGVSKLLEASFQALLSDLGQSSDLLWAFVSSVYILAVVVPSPDVRSFRESFSWADRPAEGLQGVKLLLLSHSALRQTPSF